MSATQMMTWSYLIAREWSTAARYADMEGRLWCPVIRNKAH